MKKLVIVLALIVLGLVIAGCGIEPATTDEIDFSDITAEVAVIDAELDSDLTELEALDQELADIEALDLG
jgi:hypothetical protein